MTGFLKFYVCHKSPFLLLIMLFVLFCYCSRGAEGAHSNSLPPTAGNNNHSNNLPKNNNNTATTTTVLPVGGAATRASTTSSPQKHNSTLTTTTTLGCDKNSSSAACHNNNNTTIHTSRYHDIITQIQNNKGMLLRTLYVLIGVTSIVIIYFVVKAVRLRRRRSKSKKYGIITTPASDLEMAPLDQGDDEDDEDLTVFEMNGKPK